MLVVFLREDGRILFTWPGEVASLGKGDRVLFRQREYVVLRKQFDADAGAMEMFLEERGDDSLATAAPACPSNSGEG